MVAHEKRDREAPHEGGMSIFLKRVSTQLVIPGPAGKRSYNARRV
jgi:hypothetical protein